MKKVLLLDYQHDLKNPIRKAVTGTFGSKTEVKGIMGALYTRMKSKGVVIPPMYFAYATAIFKQAGWSVKHAYRFDEEAYDLIIFATSMPGHNDELDAIKNYRKNHSAPIVVAGAFSKERPELFKEVVDGIIVDGEPEMAFTILAKGKTPFGPEQKILSFGQVENPDDLPFPDWEAFDYKGFRYSPMLKGIAVPFLTSRGCPYNCDYCHYMPEAGPKIRYRSLDKVIEELKYLKSLGINNVVFRDLVFTLNKKRTLDLCQRILDENLQMSWAIETRIDRLSSDLVDKMKEAGLKHLNLGIESPDPKVLKSVGRLPANLQHQADIIAYIQDQGLSVSAFYIIGFIQDDHESVQNTIAYAAKLNTLAAQFCIMTPFPGTKLFDELSGRINTEDWSRYSEYHATLNLDNLSAKEIESYRDQAYRDYYLRPAWILRHWRRLV